MTVLGILARLKVYPGTPHGLMATHRDQFNADLLDRSKAAEDRGSGGESADGRGSASPARCPKRVGL
jgi:hypothetical protein